MVKRFLTLVLLVVLATSVLFGQAKNGGLARQISMGGSFAGSNLVLNPFIMEDPAVMLVNPAYQSLYKDYLWMNIGGGTVNGLTTGNNGYGNQNAGVNFGFGKTLSVGAILSYDPSGVSGLPGDLQAYMNLIPGARPAQTGLAPVDVFEVVGAVDIGSLDVGLGILYGWSNRDEKNAPPGGVTPPASNNAELSASVLGFRAGMRFDLGAGSAFDASAALRLDKVTDKITGTTGTGTAANAGEYSVSATEIMVNARLKLKMSNRVNFVPYAVFATMSGEPKEDAFPTGGTATTISIKSRSTGIGVGAGMEYHLPQFYLAGGISWQSAKEKVEFSPGGTAGTTTVSDTRSAFPVFNLGAEWWLTDWLAGRAGYYRAFQNVNHKDERPAPLAAYERNIFGGTSSVVIGGYGGADNSLITLGMGLRFGGFGMDATVSEEALRRGLGLIGGSDNINTFGYVTASYSFE